MSTTISLSTTRDDTEELYVLLTASSVSGIGGIEEGILTKWSDLTDDNGTATITMETAVGARLYVGYGSNLPINPVPQGPQYYGWIEFTASDVLYINLTNVDMSGLPLGLKGTRNTGESFSLGYQTPMNDIVSFLEEVLVSPDPKIITNTGQTKIVAPNIMPDSYKPFEEYIDELCEANAPLIIQSDPPESVTFTGNFVKGDSSDPVLRMTSSEGKEFVILRDQLTSSILYRCDGGTLMYDGQTYPDNSNPADNPNATITNSTFRLICVGFNEGYFSPEGENDSTKFLSLEPFVDNKGSDYARIFYQNSNSYGFAYSDNNLKTLETADPTQPVSLIIMRDDEAGPN